MCVCVCVYVCVCMCNTIACSAGYFFIRLFIGCWSLAGALDAISLELPILWLGITSAVS